jgi:hypothetical protein
MSTSESGGYKQQQQQQQQQQQYPLYPSVQHLLREHGISEADASKITASGPRGRLLKGDVLAYVGAVKADYLTDLAARVAKLGHLDLSNIQKAAPPPAAAAAGAGAGAGAAAAATEPAADASRKTSVAPPSAPQPAQAKTLAVPVSLSGVRHVQRRLQRSLGVDLPLSAFVARACERANRDLPAAPPSSSPSAAVSADELFDQILGLHQAQLSSSSATARGKTRGGHHASFAAELAFTPQSSQSSAAAGSASLRGQSGLARAEDDVYDVLTSGHGVTARSTTTPTTTSAANHTILESLSPSPSTFSFASSSPSSSMAPDAVAAAAGNSAALLLHLTPASGPGSQPQPQHQAQDEPRAKIFLDRVKSALENEPGQLLF